MGGWFSRSSDLRETLVENEAETVTVAYCREQLKEILGTHEPEAPPVNDWREKLELNKELKRDIIGTKRSECGRFHIPNPKSPKSFSDLLFIKQANLLELNLIQVNLFSDWGGRTLLKETCPNLRILKISGAPLKSLTDDDLELPEHLSILVLSRCELCVFELTLPKTLEKLSLEYNRLETLPACIEGLRPALLAQKLTINLQGNDFWFSEGIPMTRVNANTIGELCRANDYGFLPTYLLNDALRFLKHKHKIMLKNTTYMDKQSVHLQSVQASLADAVAHVMAASPDIPWNRNYLNVLFKHTKVSTHVQTMIRRSCANTITHMGLGVTFGALLERLVAMIETMNETRRESIYSIMSTELQLIGPVCLTGQFTHLLGCLNGLVEGFNIGIDASEVLANTMATIRNKWAERCGDDINSYIENAIPEAMQALEDSCISHEEQQNWLAGM